MSDLSEVKEIVSRHEAVFLRLPEDKGTRGERGRARADGGGGEGGRVLLLLHLYLKPRLKTRLNVSLLIFLTTLPPLQSQIGLFSFSSLLSHRYKLKFVFPCSRRSSLLPPPLKKFNVDSPLSPRPSIPLLPKLVPPHSSKSLPSPFSTSTSLSSFATTL